MKKYVNKNVLLNFIVNFLSLLLIELIFKLVNNLSLLDWSFIRIIISSSIISLFIALIEYLIPKKVHKFINCILIFIVSFYAFVQSGFNNFIGVYMSLGTSSQLGAVVDYIKEFILSFKWYYYLCFIPFILILIYYIFINKKVFKKFNITYSRTKFKNLNKKLFLIKTLITSFNLVVLCMLFYLTLTISFMQNKLQSVSNMKLFINPNNPTLVAKEFGITAFGILDVKNYLFPVQEEFIIEIDDDKKDNQNVVERVYDDTIWNELIETETNKKINSLNKYFISNDITDTNEYTGLFEGKNLIVIMLESVNDIIINEEDYPNFYKMYSEGWHWENNFSPRNSCSTGNNEMSGMISLYSIYNTCTANNYKTNTYFESIFGLFNNENYYTFSAHDYVAHYYDRNVIHTNMGSSAYYGAYDLGMNYSSEYKNWASDEEFMEKVLELIDGIESDNFMTWLTTVTSHQPYSISSIQGDYYADLYQGRGLKTDLIRYKSKLKYLDNALGILLEGLESRGLLEDTVIVMFGDHYPYGLSTDTINTVLDYDTNTDNDKERVPFVIYNPSLESTTYEEYTSYINILPTLANLFGLDYDPRLYVGSDILSNDYQSMVVFADGSWKNEYAFYNASKGNIKYYTDKEYTTEELQEINDTINLKMSMSSLAIKNNYFKYLYENVYSKLEIEEVPDENEENITSH